MKRVNYPILKPNRRKIGGLQAQNQGATSISTTAAMKMDSLGCVGINLGTNIANWKKYREIVIAVTW